MLAAHDPDLYALICDEALLRPANAEHVERLHCVMAAVLKKYVESFYHKRQLRWDSAKMVYAPLKKDDDNFQDYVVKVPRGDPELVKSIKEIIDEGNRIYRTLCADLPGLYLERHLYQPLLIRKGGRVKCAPPPLNDGEQRFVRDLIELCRTKPALLEKKELFLLRNLSRGKGIGFFEDSGFYPDFILWVTEGEQQRLVFIEPHGMLHEDYPTINRKANLHKELQNHVADARKKSKKKHLMLDSFLVTGTPFDELRRKHGLEWDRAEYAKAHILFFGEDGDRTYLETIIAGSPTTRVSS